MAHADLLRPLPFPPGPMGPGWNVSSCTQSPTRNASFCVSGAGLGSAGGAAVGAASAAGLGAGAGGGGGGGGGGRGGARGGGGLGRGAGGRRGRGGLRVGERGNGRHERQQDQLLHGSVLGSVRGSEGSVVGLEGAGDEAEATREQREHDQRV